MNLTPLGRLGWSWTINGITYHTDGDGKGRYWKRLLLDSEFVAPRSRADMIKFLAKGEVI